MGANGLKLSLFLTFKFNFFWVSSFIAEAKIHLFPKALGPNSALFLAIATHLFSLISSLATSLANCSWFNFFIFSV